jgi:hypothetical protein
MEMDFIRLKSRGRESKIEVRYSLGYDTKFASIRMANRS